MIRRRGKIARTLLVLGSAAPTIADGARGLWRDQKWLVPLIAFALMEGSLQFLLSHPRVALWSPTTRRSASSSPARRRAVSRQR